MPDDDYRNTGSILIKRDKGRWTISGSWTDANNNKFDLGYAIAPAIRQIPGFVDNMGRELAQAIQGKGIQRKGRQDG